MDDLRVIRTNDKRQRYLGACNDCQFHIGHRVCAIGAEIDREYEEGFPEGCPLPKPHVPALGPCPVCGKEGRVMLGRCSSDISTRCDNCGFGRNYGGFTIKYCVQDWKEDYADAERIRAETGAALGEGCSTCEYLVCEGKRSYCQMASACSLPDIRICDMYVKKGEGKLKGKDSYGCLPCPLCGNANLDHISNDQGYSITDISCKKCGFRTDIHDWNKLAEKCRKRE